LEKNRSVPEIWEPKFHRNQRTDPIGLGRTERPGLAAGTSYGGRQV
jgi:hypothetical protein